MRIPNPRRGFTLIEILIVISIIAILASLVLGGVQMARKYAMRAQAQQQVSNLFTTLKHYVQDTGSYPGASYRDDQNAFPALFEVLCGEKPPRGKGGPNSPYLEFKQSDIAVWDGDSEAYRTATRDELNDQRVEKYMVDPWGQPIIYRENKSRARKPYMRRPTEADIYSTGPDKEDQSGPDADPDTDGGDDIGNW